MSNFQSTRLMGEERLRQRGDEGDKVRQKCSAETQVKNPAQKWPNIHHLCIFHYFIKKVVLWQWFDDVLDHYK